MEKTTFLDFEQPIAELESKIEELRYVQNESAVDISAEIAFDDPLEGTYDSVDKLPQWVQERLAVLSMLPVADNQVVAGVGRKISDTIYWANKPTM